MTFDFNLASDLSSVWSSDASSQPFLTDPSPAELEDSSSIRNPTQTYQFTDQEKFELLSAYLDNEVSESERCLVKYWLSSDLVLRQHYQAQIKLRKAMRLLTC